MFLLLRYVYFVLYSIWSLQDLNEIGTEKRRLSVRKSTSVGTNRRLSMMPGKLVGGNNVTTGETIDEIFTMNSHGVLKLEMAMLGMYPKIFSFCMLKHPYFTSEIYATSSKTSTIAIVQVYILNFY